MTALAYTAAQVVGGCVGAVVANVMFELPAYRGLDHVRSSGALWFSEVVATIGLLLVIHGCVRTGRGDVVAVAVGVWIGGAYWFTSSTSFANPAVTIARTLSDSFAGIAPSSAPMFILMQLVGASSAFVLIRFIYPSPASPWSDTPCPTSSTLTLDQQHALRTAATRLRGEFDGVFSTETIERFLQTSYDQFAGRATVSQLPAVDGRTLRPPTPPGPGPKVEGASTDGTPIVLFLCVHNAGRSQMALGWFNHLAGDRAVAWSGGSEPGTEINPAAVAAMAEVGIDITAEFPKPWTEEIIRAADVVITMGCGDACPLYPGKRYEDWELDDPAGQDLAAVRPDPRRDPSPRRSPPRPGRGYLAALDRATESRAFQTASGCSARSGAAWPTPLDRSPQAGRAGVELPLACLRGEAGSRSRWRGEPPPALSDTY